MANELRDAIIRTSKQLGISPEDLATAMSYETAGTFDPWKAGPTTQWGQHRGLIQWGEPQQRQYGVSKDMPVGAQVDAAGRYLVDAGVKPGMGLLDVYSAINAGHVGKYGASDAGNGGAPGTVRDKVEQQMGGHRRNAERLLGAAVMPDGPKGQEMSPPPLTAGKPVNDYPVGQPPAAMPSIDVAGQGEPAPESGLSRIFAALAPMAGSMDGGGGMPQGGPAQSFGSGDPMGATFAAAQAADKARGLAAGLAPDIQALMALGKRPGAALVG